MPLDESLEALFLIGNYVLFDGVQLSISRSSISCDGKKHIAFTLNVADIFADNMIYYVID